MRRRFNGLMMAAFVLSAVVQYNDPDPIPWMMVYLSALVLCVAWHQGRLAWWFFAAASGSSVLASVLVASVVPSGADVWVAVGDWHMSEAGSELIRESGGLGLVALWMAVLAVWRRAETRPHQT